MIADLGQPLDNYWVDENHERIARIIKDYDPELELAFIPPANREPGDVPFAVIHRPAGQPAYIVGTYWHCDGRILEDLFMADNKQGDVLDRMDAHNAAVEAIRLKELADKEAETADLAWHILRSPLNTYKHDGIKYQ